SRRTDDVETLYVPLDAEARLPGGFWLTVRDSLVQADLAADGAAGGNGERGEAEQSVVRRALAHREEPVRLVLDNYHEAGLLDGRAEIGDDLLELVRTSPALELVVATRALRSLETTGALSVDITVVRPADLAMHAEDVIALGERHGVTVTQDQAAQVVVELGGWPAAVRACVSAAAVGGHEVVVDPGTVDGYIETLLADVRSAALREFLLRTSIPEE